MWAQVSPGSCAKSASVLQESWLPLVTSGCTRCQKNILFSKKIFGSFNQTQFCLVIGESLREGSRGSQKIYSCSCWMTSSFLSHWPQPNIREFKSFLSHPALDHIRVSLGLWSSSQLLVVALLFLLFTITSSLHGEPPVQLSQQVSSASLSEKLLCFFGKWLPEEMRHEEVIILRRRTEYMWNWIAGTAWEASLRAVKSRVCFF